MKTQITNKQKGRYTGLLLMILIISLSSCFQSNVITSDLSQARIIEQKQVYYFWGMYPREIKMTKPCKSDILVGSKRSVSLLDGVIANLSFGIYTKLEMKYYCRKGRAIY